MLLENNGIMGIGSTQKSHLRNGTWGQMVRFYCFV